MQELLVKFGLGVVFLLVSAQSFVNLAIKVSRALRISPLIVGTTLVALGTSLPELAVSTIASARGDTGLAIGNIVGSNVVNILLVLPIGILIGKLRIGTHKTQRNGLLLLGVTALFIALRLLQLPPTTAGLILLLTAVVITIAEYFWGVNGRNHEDASRFSRVSSQRLAPSDALLLTLSAAGITVGGVLMVTSTEGLASITGYSTTILGLSLTAVATSLPELLTTIFSQEDHQEKITTGNIVGSNIYNLLFIGGITLLLSGPLSAGPKEFTWLILATIGAVTLIHYYKGQRVPKRIGVVFLLGLIVYLSTLALATPSA